jgi:hypothetical protein
MKFMEVFLKSNLEFEDKDKEKKKEKEDSFNKEIDKTIF